MAGDPRPRLLVVVTHPMSASLLMRGQLEFLVSRGFDVAVVASPGPELDEVAAREDVPVFGVPMTREISPLRDLASLFGIVRAIRGFRPAIVSAGAPKGGLLGMLAARLAGTQARVYVLHGLRLETATGVRRRVLAAAERAAAACACTVVCVSESLRARAVGLGVVHEAKATVLGPGSFNGVDVGRFRPGRRQTPEVSRLRVSLALPEGSPVVGFVGRLTRDKGIEDLLTALEVVRERVPNARGLLVGGFEEGDSLPERVRSRLRADPRVIMTGFVADAAPYYSLMDVLAFPSYREGFGNAPMEAAASGVAVAGYAATGTVDSVRDGVTGTLVPVGDSRRLGEAIRSYLEDRDLRLRHGAAARARAEREFRREIVWEGWERFYRGVLEV